MCDASTICTLNLECVDAGNLFLACLSPLHHTDEGCPCLDAQGGWPSGGMLDALIICEQSEVKRAAEGTNEELGVIEIFTRLFLMPKIGTF